MGKRALIDVPILLVTAALVIFGVLMVYSASADFSYQMYGSETYVFKRQLIWLGLGSLEYELVDVLPVEKFDRAGMAYISAGGA